MSIHTDGYWGMPCWNALSHEQQRTLIDRGVLEFGWVPEGDACDRPAELEITTMYDEAPGPRFYCTPCGIEHLSDINRGVSSGNQRRTGSESLQS